MARKSERFIYINRWPDFQHYKDNTRPPWIKAYTRLMQDDAYLELTEHQALMLHRLWLTYASASRHLSVNTSSLSRHLHMRVMTRDLEALNRAGFIRICSRATLEKLYTRERSRDRERKPGLTEARPQSNGQGSEPIFEMPELRVFQ